MEYDIDNKLTGDKIINDKLIDNKKTGNKDTGNEGGNYSNICFNCSCFYYCGNIFAVLAIFG
jgi:hypothetical protein